MLIECGKELSHGTGGLAKTVIVRTNGRLMMVVVRAAGMVDLKSSEKLVVAADVGLAREDEFGRVFGECEPGEMPPFGNLYAMDVIAGSDLAEDREIAFNAGTHRRTPPLRAACRRGGRPPALT